MVGTKKKVRVERGKKEDPPKVDADKNFQAAFEWLVEELAWRGKCPDLVTEAKKLL